MTEPPAEPIRCEDEPIHIPGRIQPHGVLLALRTPDLIVVQASENAADLLGQTPDALLGRPLGAVLDLGPERLALLREAQAGAAAGPLPLFAPDAGAFDAVAHASEGVLVLEMEPAPPAERPAPDPLQRLLTEAIPHIRGAETLTELCAAAARQVRGLTGFDRVMIYRFDENWNGAVVAEDRIDALEPFLGLHYPASDIPQQARDLYLRNPIRLIADVSATPAAVLPAVNPVTGRPLDMTQAVLRAVSPTHIEYLRNMGVAASMSIGIVRDGALWGLIACHHRTARTVGYRLRTACELLGQVVSLQIAAKSAAEEHAHLVHLKSLQARFVAAISAAGDLSRGFRAQETSLLDFGRAGGAALTVNGECYRLGRTPDEDEIRRLAGWLARRDAAGETFHTDSLPAVYEPARRFPEIASGLLAISLSRVRNGWLLWFRPEVIRTVDWAGNPEKAVAASRDGRRLSPRASFALWKQTVRATALPWTPPEIEAAADLRSALLEVVLHLTELERDKRERNAALDRQRRIAETLQFSLLLEPDENAFPGLEVAPFHQAAWQEAEVGGDFFDALTLPDGRVALAVGDVTGKGLGAARRMMEAKFALRVLLSEEPDPARTLFRLNNFLCGDRLRTPAETADGLALTFVALLLVVLDTASGKAAVAVAGAEPPLILRAGGQTESVTTGDVPLGIVADFDYQAVSLRLEAGDVLLLTTDGLTEARRGDELFGYEALTELGRRAAGSGDLPLRQLGQTLLNDVRAFAGGALQDDVCLLLARRRG